jgi:hypothetical protein
MSTLPFEENAAETKFPGLWQFVLMILPGVYAG